MDVTGILAIFALLLAGHAVADYPLQGAYLSKVKNRRRSDPESPWYLGLAAHGAIHGGAVGLVTGSLALGVAEFVAHCVIDDAKCMGRISSTTDQSLHVACKAAWCGAIWSFGPIP